MDNSIIFILTVFLTSSVSGMTGMGGGVMLLAFMTPFFPPAVLIPLHGTIQLGSNLSRVFISPKKVNLNIVLYFTAGSLLGAAAGAPLSINIPETLSSILIGTAILVFTWLPGYKGISGKNSLFLPVGSAASFLALFIGSTGPLIAPFFVNSELDRDSLVPTKAACQIPIHFFKVIVYVLSGFVITAWLPEILLSVPAVVGGSIVGKLAAGRLNDRHYKILLKLVITFLAVRMLIKVLF